MTARPVIASDGNRRPSTRDPKLRATGLGSAIAAGIRLGEEVAAALVTPITLAVGHLGPDRRADSADAGGPEGGRPRSTAVAGLSAVGLLALVPPL